MPYRRFAVILLIVLLPFLIIVQLIMIKYIDCRSGVVTFKMLWNTVLILALGLSQVLASDAEPEYAEVDFIENVLKAEAEAGTEASGARIVSGWEAYPGQHPQQVSLRLVDGAGDVSSCGGSVVHRSWVLSAAHCTALRTTLVIRAGVTHLTRPEYLSESTEWFNHPSYNDLLPTVVQPDDIAIIRLRQPLTFSNLVKPIRLQSTADAFRNYEGQTLIASGFGRTWTLGGTPETLNWVYLRGVSNPTCFQIFGSLITNNAICAQFYNVTSQSTCQGDSGGPLVHIGADGEPDLIGVASFVAGGDFGCHSGFPAGFIRTGPYHSWLTQVTGLDFENLEEEDVTEAPTTTEAPTSTEAPTTAESPTTTEAPTTQAPDSEEDEEETEAPEDSSEEKDKETEEDSSDSDDCELSELLKKLEVKVSVKVKVNKYKKQKKH